MMMVRRFTGLLVAALAVGFAAAGTTAVAGPPDNDGPTINIDQGLHFAVGATVSTGNPATVAVQAQWDQYDDSGICSENGYVQDTSIGGQPTIASFNGVQTAVSFTATVGHYYRVTINATDCSDNANTGAGYGYYSAPTLAQEGSATYSPGWTTSNCKCFSGGTNEHTARKGATASFKYTGEGIGFVTEESSARGTASIYIDGVLKATLNAHTAGVYNSVVGFQYYVDSSKTHTLKIVVKTGRIDVDAFLVSGY